LWAPSEQKYFTPQRTLHLLSGTCGGGLWDSLGGKPLTDLNSVLKIAKNEIEGLNSKIRFRTAKCVEFLKFLNKILQQRENMQL
jgi:hypothetical protein